MWRRVHRQEVHSILFGVDPPPPAAGRARLSGGFGCYLSSATIWHRSRGYAFSRIQLMMTGCISLPDGATTCPIGPARGVFPLSYKRQPTGFASGLNASMESVIGGSPAVGRTMVGWRVELPSKASRVSMYARYYPRLNNQSAHSAWRFVDGL